MLLLLLLLPQRKAAKTCCCKAYYVTVCQPASRSNMWLYQHSKQPTAVQPRLLPGCEQRSCHQHRWSRFFRLHRGRTHAMHSGLEAIRPVTDGRQMG